MINLLQYIQGALLIKDSALFLIQNAFYISFSAYLEDVTAADQKRGRLWRDIRRIDRHFRLGLKILQFLKRGLKCKSSD